MAFGHQYEITINCINGESIHITDIDADFSCVLDNEKEPNEADLTLWGLTADTQNLIAQTGSTIIIAAGYEDEGAFTLFQGEIINAITVKPAEVYGLQMKIYEALIPYRASITSRTFRKGQSLKDAVALVAFDMGLGYQFSSQAGALTLAKNISAAALSRDVLSSLCGPVNAEWSIQHQSIIVTAGDPILTGAVVFTPETGLIGTPKLKTHTQKRTRKQGASDKEIIAKKHNDSITTFSWPPKNAQVDYSKGARRQIGVIEAITWESLIHGGIDIGEQVEISSPSMGEGWLVIVKKVRHRFSTKGGNVWTSSWEGVIA